MKLEMNVFMLGEIFESWSKDYLASGSFNQYSLAVVACLKHSRWYMSPAVKEITQ